MIVFSIIGAVFGFVWGVICALASGAFWLALASLGLGALVVLGAIIRPQLFQLSVSRFAAPSSTDELRKALRSGALDAEIERVNLRNRQRRRA